VSRRLGLAAALIVISVALGVLWAAIATWCQHFFGFASGDGNDPHYLFWSGAGSDLAYMSFLVSGLAAAGHVYWRFTCHEPKCWRPGHLMADGHTRSCWTHHPDGKPRPGHVQRAHERHQAAQGG
jgi:hypothetical protein